MLATSGYGDGDVRLGGRIEIDKDEYAPVYFGFFGHLAEKEVIQARFPRKQGVHYCTLLSSACTLQTANCTLHTAHCTLQTAHCTLQTAHCTLHAALRQVLQFFFKFPTKDLPGLPNTLQACHTAERTGGLQMRASHNIA